MKTIKELKEWHIKHRPKEEDYPKAPEAMEDIWLIESLFLDRITPIIKGILEAQKKKADALRKKEKCATAKAVEKSTKFFIKKKIEEEKDKCQIIIKKINAVIISGHYSEMLTEEEAREMADRNAHKVKALQDIINIIK